MQFIDVVVGGQYGSEAKGHVTAQLVKAARRNLDQATTEGVPDASDARIINIRVAGPNAGHTAYNEFGKAFAFRSLPVGAVVDEEALLYIAPGSEVDLDVLYDEIARAEGSGHFVRHRLYVSRQATLLEQSHKDTENRWNLVSRVGSTGKGIGAARADRIMRTAQTLGDYFDAQGEDGRAPWWNWAEPEDLYATDDLAHNRITHVIVEGTQGYGLSLRASGHYPQVTSSDARSIDFLAMAGIDPTRCSVKVNNWVVARVYPIRVAGNSGPMKGETTWEDLGLPEEKTTVTQKVRRVGEWDAELVERAIQANGGHKAKLVITMLDQVIPGLAEIDPERFTSDEAYRDQHADAMQGALDWANEHVVEAGVSAPVAAFTFGPDKILFTEHAQERGLPELPGPQDLLRAVLGGE